MENFFKKAALGVALFIPQAAEGQTTQQLKTPTNHEKVVNLETEYLKMQLQDILKDNKDIFTYIDYQAGMEANQDITDRNKIDSVFKAKTEWIASYAQSPAYRNILIKEFIRSGASGDIEAMVDSCIQSRLARIMDPKKDVAQEDFTDDNSLGYYEDDTVHVAAADFYIDGPNTITHEKGHQLVDGIEGLTTYVRTEIQKRIREDSGYYSKPSEIFARLLTLKNICAENAVYDPRYQKFTLENFKDIIRNPDIMASQDVVDLFEHVKTVEDLIWLMNNIA